jgi:DNA-binding PadR family transcriptional regulator
MSPLNYALLGLIRDEPRTGYALRMVFETTPMGNYSSSPGSIYPALKGLEKAGLIEARAAGARRSLYFLTPAGGKRFGQWLVSPVTEAESSDSALLRFAFLHDHPDKTVTLSFLKSFALAASGRVTALKAFLNSENGLAMPLQARLAVEHGMRTTEASAQWAADTYNILKGETT